MHLHTRSFARRQRRALAAGLLLTILGTGCDWLVPWTFFAKHKEKVTAEFSRLENHRVAVVVWAGQDTLFDYPHVRMEIGLHVASRLIGEVDGIEAIDNRRIEDFMQRRMTFTVDPVAIGREFDAEIVVYIELLEFQIRDPQSPDFLRGKILSSVVVHDLTEELDQPRRYPLEKVVAEYPELRTLLFTDTNAAVVRKELYEVFGEKVARKFYDHELEMN